MVFAGLCFLADEVPEVMHQNDRRPAHLFQAGGIFLLPCNAAQGNTIPVSFRGKFYFVKLLYCLHIRYHGIIMKKIGLIEN